MKPMLKYTIPLPRDTVRWLKVYGKYVGCGPREMARRLLMAFQQHNKNGAALADAIPIHDGWKPPKTRAALPQKPKE